MPGMQYLLASAYSGISDRSAQLGDVRRELNAVVNAQPTQVQPEQRTLLLEALLADLEDRETAPWAKWPDDVHALALAAVKVLGRNPVGSEPLLAPKHFKTLLHHTALPLPHSPSPFSHPSPEISSPQALDALRIIANTCVLHGDKGRDRLAASGAAKALAIALANKDADGEYMSETDEEDFGRLFLLARLGFLVTLERGAAVRTMVDTEELVDSLVYHLTTTQPVPANFTTLSELLKLTNNVIRFYPHRKSTNREASDWDDRLEPLLWPSLCLFYSIPCSELLPPLSHCIHVLMSIPVRSRLKPTWHSAPAQVAAASPTSSVRALLNRLSGNLSVNSARRGSSSTASTHSSRSRTPSPTPPARLCNLKRVPKVTEKQDAITALPLRLLKILDGFCNTYLSSPTSPDKLDDALKVDELLPPLLLLMSRVAEGSVEQSAVLREALLPSNLDRSAAAGPLETRKGVLGTLIRFMSCTRHQQTRNSAGELLWAVCGADASTLNAEIGYGNAAGLLFAKGMSGPPPGKISEIPSATEPRHPITALADNGVDHSEAFRTMSEEEKEREAERLFGLFDRMDRNPVISTKGPDGEKKGIKDTMRERYAEVDKTWAEKEKKQQEAEDEADEEAVRKEMEAYKKRTGKA